MNLYHLRLSILTFIFLIFTNLIASDNGFGDTGLFIEIDGNYTDDENIQPCMHHNNQSHFSIKLSEIENFRNESRKNDLRKKSTPNETGSVKKQSLTKEQIESLRLQALEPAKLRASQQEPRSSFSIWSCLLCRGEQSQVYDSQDSK